MNNVKWLLPLAFVVVTSFGGQNVKREKEAGFMIPSPDAFIVVARPVGSWALGEVLWTEPSSARIKSEDTAKLTVNVSASSNISDEASVDLDIKMIKTEPDSSDENEAFKFVINPPEVKLKGADVRSGTVQIVFTVLFKSGNPPAGGLRFKGRAKLSNSMMSDIDDPPFQDSANELILLPTNQ